MPLRFDDIGNRLKAFRLGSGLAAEEIAQQLGISRTALYRFEKGEVAKIETLEKLAELLKVSVPTLLGVGVEYIASAVSYFERMRQIEETAEHIIVLAGPISYVLASDGFDGALGDILRESVPDGIAKRERALAQIDELMAVLRSRKDSYRRRRPAIVNLIAAAEMERFLRNGLVGRLDLDDKNSPRAARARPRRGRAFHRADGERADRRADRHRARYAAAYELPDLPPARPQDFGVKPVPPRRGAEYPHRRRHDHLGARSAGAARNHGARAVGQRAQRPGRGALHARHDGEGGRVSGEANAQRFPGAARHEAKRNDALQTRDRRKHGGREGPGSAVHRYAFAARCTASGKHAVSGGHSYCGSLLSSTPYACGWYGPRLPAFRFLSFFVARMNEVKSGSGMKARRSYPDIAPLIRATGYGPFDIAV